MKKSKLAVFALFLNISVTFAGGLLTNTNQSVHFLRNPARDASTGIDAVYTNPAGIIKLGEGLHFSFTNQSAFQTRTITSTSPIYLMNGGKDTREFKGKASAPIIPSIQGVYRKGNWALSGSFAISGGGGKATFNHGLPSFEAAAGTSVRLINQAQALTGFKANQYQVDQWMKGSNFIFGGQLGGTYKINDMFSAYAGFRLNIVHNKYEGYLRGLKVNLTPTSIDGYGSQMVYATQILEAIAANPSISEEQRQMIGILTKASSDEGALLESTQSGWGVAPILGFNFNYLNKLNIGLKYEFKTSLDIENDTKRDDTGMFKDGVNTAHDIPALLTVGASYQITPKLQASIGYHHFFDSNAKMATIANPNNPSERIGKEKFAGSTNEYLAGLEYRINEMFLISTGGQITRYGIKNNYQSDLSFSCNSYSLGLGGEITISPKVKINIGYFWTNYSDYTKEPGGGIGSVNTDKDIFSRTNKVFGAGVDFSF